MHDHFNHGDSFYKKHPELRGADRAGNATPRISYAYPEVREFVVSLLSEMAEFPIDGICLLYNRRPPLVEYEPPVVQGFIDEFGEDPRQLDSMDSRWLSYRARVLTQFMREVREAMVAAASERGLSKPNRSVGRRWRHSRGEPDQRHRSGGVGQGGSRRHINSLRVGIHP